MEIATRNYQEKRNFIRMKINSPMNLSREGEKMCGTCIDLSGGGMLVALDQVKGLEPGKLVEIAISSNHGHNPILKALTQVSRITARDVGYFVGLEIKQLIEA